MMSRTSQLSDVSARAAGDSARGSRRVIVRYLASAEAVLKLCGLRVNGDLDAYWACHEQEEHRVPEPIWHFHMIARRLH
jgi:hypothetical protein